MRIFITIILITLLPPPLPQIKKFKGSVKKAGAQQLLFTPSVTNITKEIILKFNYPTNYQTNNWCLVASSNLNNWFIYPTNWIYFRPDGDIQITNKYPQMYFKVWFP